MHRVIRAGYTVAKKPVELDNNVGQPEQSTENGPSEEELRAAEEKKRALEEKKRVENEIAGRVNDILAGKAAEADAEAARIISEAKTRANKIEADAQSAAKQLIERAEADGVGIRQKAHDEGYAAGYEEGKKSAAAKCESYLAAAAEFMEQINSHKDAYYISNEEQFRDTVYEAAEKITMTQLSRDDRMIERIIAQAAKTFRNSDFVKITVMQGEVSQEMRTDKEYIKSIISHIPEIEVEYLPDNEENSGTAVLDDGSEIIDASVPTQLEFLKEIINTPHGGDEEEQG